MVIERPQSGMNWWTAWNVWYASTSKVLLVIQYNYTKFGITVYQYTSYLTLCQNTEIDQKADILRTKPCAQLPSDLATRTASPTATVSRGSPHAWRWPRDGWSSIHWLITIDYGLKTSKIWKIIYKDSNSTWSNSKLCLAVAHSAAEMEPNPAPYITTQRFFWRISQRWFYHSDKARQHPEQSSRKDCPCKPNKLCKLSLCPKNQSSPQHVSWRISTQDLDQYVKQQRPARRNASKTSLMPYARGEDMVLRCLRQKKLVELALPHSLQCLKSIKKCVPAWIVIMHRSNNCRENIWVLWSFSVFCAICSMLMSKCEDPAKHGDKLPNMSTIALLCRSNPKYSPGKKCLFRIV